MDYYTKHILLRTGDSQSTLQSVVDELSVRLDRGQMGEYKVTKIDCPEGTIVVGPDDGEIPLRPVTHIHVTAGLTSTKTLIKGDTQFDQSLLVPNIEVTDLMTGEQRTFNPAEVGLGVDTVLDPETLRILGLACFISARASAGMSRSSTWWNRFNLANCSAQPSPKT